MNWLKRLLSKRAMIEMRLSRALQPKKMGLRAAFRLLGRTVLM